MGQVRQPEDPNMDRTSLERDLRASLHRHFPLRADHWLHGALLHLHDRHHLLNGLRQLPRHDDSPSQITDFLYGASYPFTLPFMFMILPLYCLFNMDDVSWGTREAKNPNKSFKKPEGAAARDEKSIQWTFDIF